MSDKAPGRRLECISLKPGFSIYLGRVSYAATSLHQTTYPKLRMWDAGPYCLLQATDEAGKVIDEAELMWDSVYWRKAAKP